MEFETGHFWNQAQAVHPDLPRGVPRGVSRFLAWLMIWLRVCVGRPKRQSVQPARWIYQPNRQRRRMQCRVRGRDIPPTRNNRPYYSMVRRSMTPGQFIEWLALYSGRGRVAVFRMRYWRKTVKGKAAPLGTEHEYWRDPLGRIGGRMAKLLCGVWAVHLWPGWRPLAYPLKHS